MKKIESEFEVNEYPPMSRKNILTCARDISDARADDHGDFGQNMEHIGELTSLCLERMRATISLPMFHEAPGFYAAFCLALVKISRICCGKPSQDDFIDCTNYLAQAGTMLLAWQKEHEKEQIEPGED